MVPIYFKFVDRKSIRQKYTRSVSEAMHYHGFQKWQSHNFLQTHFRSKKNTEVRFSFEFFICINLLFQFEYIYPYVLSFQSHVYQYRRNREENFIRRNYGVENDDIFEHTSRS